MDHKTLCDIIKSCGEFGVSKIKYGDLYLEFGQKEPKAEIKISHPPDSELQGEARKSLLQDEQKIKQDQLEQMLLEDPAGYEDLILKGELLDGSRPPE